MTEPTYIYRKGEGWIVSPPYETHTITNDEGTFRIERRKPSAGESYTFNLGRLWDWEEWVSWAGWGSLKRRKTYPYPDDRDLDGRTDVDWLTIITL
jgi:hypothetical protein